jgi:hypothetical protein
MPWIVGIDEAGYGPNLGPFVMTSVACRVPERRVGIDLWHLLRDGVRRATDAADGRILVADSKLVYSPGRGLRGLEMGVLATLPTLVCGTGTLSSLLDALCPGSHTDLRREPWFTGATPLPTLAPLADCADAAARLAQICRKQRVSWGLVRSVLVCPARFNGLLDRAGSKGAVLGHALAELLRYSCDAEPSEALHFFIDKHGGRNSYAALLQAALPGSMVVAHEEGIERSVYSALGLRCPVRLTIQPRADVEHFCVALASMVSKYLRELLMREFNEFWQHQVPGLKPTAGYPGDAARFLDAIRPTLGRVGVAESAVWRRK